jgi:hypothetical protein
MIIMRGKTSSGETVRIKDAEKDLKEREMFMEEIERDEKEFDKIKMEKDILKELTEENQFLRKRVAELEFKR